MRSERAAPGDRAPRVLVLSAGFGSGHDAAAAALAEAIRRAGGTARIVDHFRAFVHPVFERWSRWLYEAMLYRAPALWGAAYALGDRLTPSSRLTFDANRLGSARLGRLLRAERPDCVACTHPTPAGALDRLRAQGVATPPYGVVFSDFTVHAQWIHPGADAHYAPAEPLREALVARGLPADRVVATGIPVRAVFAAGCDRLGARAALGLDPNAPVVLVMAGATGRLGRLPAVARVLGALPPAIQAVVIAGRDADVAARLRAQVGDRGRTRVLGYVDQVRELMAAADVLVTKAGGLSLAEALAAELPIVCFGSLPGHEARNEAFVVGAGAALAAGTEGELAEVLRRLLARPEELEALRAAGQHLRRPHAARDAAAHLLALPRLTPPHVSQYSER